MSDIVTTTGQSIGNYPNYKEGKTAAEQATFVATAKIPLAGKYDESDESMETKSVMLSELGGGGGLPSTSGNEGKFLTVNSSEEAVWGNAPKAVTAITAGAGMAVSGSGSVSVAINTSTANDGEFLKYDDGAITWGGINEVPSISGASNGDVLTVNNGAATWAAPSGGGSNVAILDLTIENVSGAWHLTTASMTPQQIMSAIESGKYVIARTLKYNNGTLVSSVQMPLGDYYNGAPYGDGYQICFGAVLGSCIWTTDAPYIAIMTTRGSLEWICSSIGGFPLWAVSDLDESDES